jgi:hypothetical protein
MLVTPLMSGLLGWQADAPARRATLAPQLPPEWTTASVRALRVGTTTVDVEFEQTPGRLRAILRPGGPDTRVTFAPMLPAGAANVAWKLDGTRATPAVWRSPRGEHPSIEVTLAGTPRTVEVTWTGGLAPVAPVREVLPGESSHALRVLDFGAAAGGWRAKVEGDAGAEYNLRVVGERFARATGAEIVSHASGMTTLRVRLAAGAGPTSVAEIALFRR